MAIFGVISMLALGGLNAVARQQEIARGQMAELGELQRAVRFLMADFAQLSPRPVRDLLGTDVELPLLADGRGDFVARLTRGGWRNPAGFRRGTLQRVQYRVEDATLIREYWPVLDAPLGLEPRTQELLDGVVDLRLEYLEPGGQWVEQWPPLNLIDAAPGIRPRAVRIELELEGLGEIRRVVEVPP